jgi:hypothetical protein
VGLERGPLSFVRVNEELLEREVVAMSRKLRLTTVADPLRSPRDNPLSTKVGTKIGRPVTVDQPIYFACGLRATEFVCFLCSVHIEVPDGGPSPDLGNY